MRESTGAAGGTGELSTTFDVDKSGDVDVAELYIVSFVSFG